METLKSKELKKEAKAKAAARKTRRLRQNLGPNLSKVALGMKKARSDHA